MNSPDAVRIGPRAAAKLRLPTDAIRGERQIEAKGTWVMDDDAFPVNYSEITCTKTSRKCTELGVNVGQPNNPAPSDDDFNLSLFSTEYSVLSWDANEVTAEIATACRRTKLTINTSTKQAFLVITDNSSEGCKLPWGTQLPQLGKPRVATLGDGFLEPKKFYDARSREAGRLVYGQFAKEIGWSSDTKPLR